MLIHKAKWFDGDVCKILCSTSNSLVICKDDDSVVSLQLRFGMVADKIMSIEQYLNLNGNYRVILITEPDILSKPFLVAEYHKGV